MREVAKDNAAGLADVLKQLQPKRSRSGYVPCHGRDAVGEALACVRASVDLKRVKEVGCSRPEFCRASSALIREVHGRGAARATDEI
jgi:hypothetical protein